MKTVGVLDLQGAVREHIQMLEQCCCKPIKIKTADQLEQIDGLIIPGGESTAIGKLMVKYGFIESILAKAKQGMPVYGTCAGMILLAKNIAGQMSQPLLSVMDITVKRNGFGRQIASFEADLTIKGLSDKPFCGVFIRAPYVESVDNDNVDVMAVCEDKIVMARQDNFLVTAFHPELTDDLRIHQYFLNMM